MSCALQLHAGNNYDTVGDNVKRESQCSCQGRPGPIGPSGKKEIRENLEYQDQKEILDQEETLVIGDHED